MFPVMFCVAPLMVICPVVKHCAPLLPGSGYDVPGAEQIKNCQCVDPGVIEPLAMIPMAKLPFESHATGDVGGISGPPLAVMVGVAPPDTLTNWGRTVQFT